MLREGWLDVHPSCWSSFVTRSFPALLYNFDRVETLASFLQRKLLYCLAETLSSEITDRT